MDIKAIIFSLLPSICLILYCSSSVRSLPQGCKGKTCPTFECPGSYNCSCMNGVNGGDYELFCPNTAGLGPDNVMKINIMPKKYVHIICTTKTHFTDYDLLKGLDIGPITSVNFRYCPLPNMSLAELIKGIGINSTNVLLFQSYRNLSNTLEKKHLLGLENIARLLLSSNGLTDLPEDLLENLNNLTWFDLRGNEIHLHQNFFQPVPQLTVLELGGNNMEYIEPGLFKNLKKLIKLNLWNNKLKNLTKETFLGLESLELLDLKSNGMESLPFDVFVELPQLKHLSILANNFTSLPEGLFQNNTQLEEIDLYDNRRSLVTLPDGFLSNLPVLQKAYLMKNNLSELPEDLFWGSNKITNISLFGNALKAIPEEIFRGLEELKTLDISYNNLLSLPDNVFKDLNKLEHLRLENNQLTTIPKYVLRGLQNLSYINLEHNRLTFIHDEAFLELVNLRTARLSHNQLAFHKPTESEELEWDFWNPHLKSPFKYCHDLEALYLANNSIDSIYEDWRITMNLLRTLDLSYNKIEGFNALDIGFISSEVSIDLKHNNISVIDLQQLNHIAREQDSLNKKNNQKQNTRRILIEGNPILCDCQAYDFFLYLEHSLLDIVYKMVQIIPGNMRCSGPKEFENQSIQNVHAKQVYCNFKEGESEEISKQCPKTCRCLYRPHDKALVIDCKDKQLETLPQQIPTVKFTNHTELILSNNSLTDFPILSSDQYRNVTHLYISHNIISTIDVEDLVPQLKVLEIDNNNITILDEAVIQYLSNTTRDLVRITLHNNPWQCECENRYLLAFIQFNYEQIPELNNITCAKDNKTISTLTISDICPYMSLAILASSVTLAVLGLVTGILAALYYKYQREIKVWLYAHRLCLCLILEEDLDKDKIYDAFVSFSHKDEDFVINTLLPGLETGPNPYKLCLHYRDWTAGEWIPNQITKSVEASRRTVVILSPNFLESIWSRMEFRAAHQQALKERIARVIVVIYGDIGNTDNLDPELKAYISMNTYVKWGDPWFWKKLKYALPHQPNLLKRKGSKKVKRVLDDRLELIHTLDSPTTPTGATTPPAESVVTSMETITPMRNGMNGHTPRV